MEDAMIINKSSYERGLFHGSVYKTYIFDIKKLLDEDSDAYFSNRKSEEKIDDKKEGEKVELEATKTRIEKSLDLDGLPEAGTKLTNGDPMVISNFKINIGKLF
jgi:DNA-directed RNA polymerase I subunit RPA2